MCIRLDGNDGIAVRLRACTLDNEFLIYSLFSFTINKITFNLLVLFGGKVVSTLREEMRTFFFFLESRTGKTGQ